MNIFQKSKVIVEIGNDWLKVWQSQSSADKIFVSNATFIKLSLVKDSIEVTLNKIFSDLKLSKDNVVLSIPHNIVTTRFLELPSDNSKELEEMIGLQVGKQTPYTKEEIVYSYSVVDSSKKGYSKIILVIARTSLVKERVDALQKIGINVVNVGFSSEGILKFWFKFSGKQLSKICAIVDIDSNFTDLMIVQDKNIVFTKNILIGANNFEENVINAKDKFIFELKKSIESFNQENKDSKIEKIIFSGAYADICEYQKGIDNELGISTEFLIYDKFLQVKQNNNFLKEHTIKSVSISAMLGFSLLFKKLKFNLDTKELHIKYLVEQQRKVLMITGFLFLSILMVVSMNLFVSYSKKVSYLEELHKKISDVETNVKQVDKMGKVIELAKDRLDSKLDGLTLMNSILASVKESIVITNMEIQRKNNIVIKAKAVNMAEVFNFVAELEKSEFLKAVKTTYTSTKKDENGEYVDFEVVGLVEL